MGNVTPTGIKTGYLMQNFGHSKRRCYVTLTNTTLAIDVNHGNTELSQAIDLHQITEIMPLQNDPQRFELIIASQKNVELIAKTAKEASQWTSEIRALMCTSDISRHSATPKANRTFDENKYEKRMAEMEELIQTLQNENNALARNIIAIENEKNEILSELNELSNEFEDLQQSKDEEFEDLEHYRNRISEDSDTIKTLTSENESLISLYNGVSLEQQKKNDMYVRELQKNAQKTSQIKSLQSKVSLLGKERNIFRNENKRLKSQGLDGYQYQSQTENESSKQNISLLRTENNELEMNLRQANERLKSDNKSALASLDDFEHKYSEKNLNKCEKQQLIEMISELYSEKQKLKQTLTENALGVGSENVFLNIDEIVSKYNTLWKQTHCILYNRLFDVLIEKKYNTEDEAVEKESFEILFYILQESNERISKEFEKLYSEIAKIIKIDTQNNSTELVSNVLQSTLQNNYESLIGVIGDEEKGHISNASNDAMSVFDLNNISKVIFNELLNRYYENTYTQILYSIQNDVINYIFHCLEVAVTMQLHKPRLYFNHLSEFNNKMNETFDENKHEQCNVEYESETEEGKLEPKPTKFIEYYCFPGLVIEHKQAQNKEKQNGNNKSSDFSVICKTQVYVE